jgi:glyoxylase-like metal-dependent hydrolase (beta-lactamase superfamily II)
MEPPPPLAFERRYTARPGEPWTVDGLPIQVVLADNPGAFTFTGTNTYVIGERELVVVDPGPALDSHFDSVLALIGSRPVAAIVVTHTHSDHSPLAPRLAAATGAPTFGFGPHPSEAPPEGSPEEGADREFRPDVRLADGQTVPGGDVAIVALHTPGHIANHLCLAVGDVVLTGDHVMGWSTSVISPRDGDLGDFYASCQRLLGRPDRMYLSAHGAPMPAPHDYLESIVAHRRFRDHQVGSLVADGLDQVEAIAAAIYPDLDEKLVKASRAMVLSHLRRLAEIGAVRQQGDDLYDPATRFTL